MKIRRLYNQAKFIAASVLVNDTVRTAVGKWRFHAKKRSLQTLQAGDSALTNTVAYNLKALSNLSTDFYMKRMKWLIYASLALETTAPWSKFLMIGPRTENEILLLKGLGYNDVTGLDLISYSPWVRLGDMHRMPFEDNSFDVVICGWTLGYSQTPRVVATEMVRVAKPGASIAIGMEHVPERVIRAGHQDSAEQNTGGDLVWTEVVRGRINTVADIVTLFPPETVDSIIFNHDAPLRARTPDQLTRITGLKSSQTMAVIRLKDHG